MIPNPINVDCSKSVVTHTHTHMLSSRFMNMLQMSSTISTFTNLHPKWGDITGSNNQAFGTVANLLEYVIVGIKGKTIAAIGMIVHGTRAVQYLYAPCIHINLGGKPISIIRNASNKLCKFTCVIMFLASLKFFPYNTPKDNAPLVPTEMSLTITF